MFAFQVLDCLWTSLEFRPTLSENLKKNIIRHAKPNCVKENLDCLVIVNPKQHCPQNAIFSCYHHHAEILPKSVYDRYFFICLIKSAWGADLNIQKQLWNPLSFTVFLLFKNVNIHFLLSSKQCKVGRDLALVEQDVKSNRVRRTCTKTQTNWTGNFFQNLIN